MSISDYARKTQYYDKSYCSKHTNTHTHTQSRTHKYCTNQTTPCHRNVPHLACYNFDTYKWILIFFCRNVTEKVSNQTMLYYATLSNLCFCTTWQNGKTRKLHFSLKAVLAHCLNSTSCLMSSALPCEIGNPQDSALVHCACNTVQLLQYSRLCFSWTMPFSSPEMIALITIFRKSYSNITLLWVGLLARRLSPIPA